MQFSQSQKARRTGLRSIISTDCRKSGPRFRVHHRRLSYESLEDRRLLSVAPLNVALISDAVAQAEEIQRAATKDTIAIIYHADTMTTAGMVDLVKSLSAAHDGALIQHLGIVAHGGPGEINVDSRF